MFAANTYVIRPANVQDRDVLTLPDDYIDQVLVGEIAGRAAAALLPDGRIVVSDPAENTGLLAACLRVRAGALRASKRTPQLSERLRAGVRLPAGDESVVSVADRLTGAMVSGEVRTLCDIYAADLRFTNHADDIERDREAALSAFASLRPQLREVSVEIVDRQVTQQGFVSQQILRCVWPDGERVTIPMCMVVRVAEGRITKIDEYFDSSSFSKESVRLQRTEVAA